MLSTALLTSALIATVSAHQNFHQFWINGETPGYQTGIRMPPSNSPVTDVTSNDITCNVNGNKVPSGVATVPATEGDTIKVQWDQSGHPGPITHFLYGPVDDASMATGLGSWVKIDELDYVNGTWANAIMEAQNMTHEFTLPTGLKSGEYLLRSEMLALHGAQTVGGAQFYIGCAQLKISGTGSGPCGPSIELPGAYKAEDPNIYIPNVYNGFDPTNYTAPGGPVGTCGGSASGSSTPKPTISASKAAAVSSGSFAASSSIAAVSSVAPVIAPSSVVTVVSSSLAGPTSSSRVSATPIVARPTTFVTSMVPTTKSASASPSITAAGTAKKYAQCGGVNFVGPTTCEAGSRCVKQNDWYFQCV